MVNEEANENKDTDGNEIKKKSKKKELSSEIFKDERFAKMFENKVWESFHWYSVGQAFELCIRIYLAPFKLDYVNAYDLCTGL